MGAGRLEVEALAMVGPDEVEGRTLAEQLGAVAGDLVRGVCTATPSPRSGNPTTTGVDALRIAASWTSLGDQDAGEKLASGELRVTRFPGNPPGARQDDAAVPLAGCWSDYEHPIAIGWSRRSRSPCQR
jgi:hypothetical protein